MSQKCVLIENFTSACAVSWISHLLLSFFWRYQRGEIYPHFSFNQLFECRIHFAYTHRTSWLLNNGYSFVCAVAVRHLQSSCPAIDWCIRFVESDQVFLLTQLINICDTCLLDGAKKNYHQMYYGLIIKGKFHGIFLTHGDINIWLVINTWLLHVTQNNNYE